MCRHPQLVVEFELNYSPWSTFGNQHGIKFSAPIYRASVQSTRAQTYTRTPLDIAKHLIGCYWRGWHEKIELDALVSLTSRLISHHIPIPQACSWAYLLALLKSQWCINILPVDIPVHTYILLLHVFLVGQIRGFQLYINIFKMQKHMCLSSLWSSAQVSKNGKVLCIDYNDI